MAVTLTPDDTDDYTLDDGPAACVVVFNANDPSGAGGINADLLTIASVGVHALSVLTGVYVRDTGELLAHHAMDDESVDEQARTILEDVPVQAIKAGFVGTPENISTVAQVASDYPEAPLVTYMPDLSWWTEDRIDAYQDACSELLLPQTTVLVGNLSTLARWLLPQWSSEKAPGPRDIATAANAFGVAYTLVTGIPVQGQFINNVLASPNSVLCSHQCTRIEATFVGAGDTLSAALTALIASETELTEAVAEAVTYLERCLQAGYRPGMGHVLPDRLFWAQTDDDDGEEPEPESSFELSPNDTRH